MTTKITAVPALLLASGLLACSAHAAPLPDCHSSDVIITRVTQFLDTTAGATTETIYDATLAGMPVGAAACAGAFRGNDGFEPTTNLGYAGDGLLNGGSQVASGRTPFPGGAFIDASHPLQDLDGDGRADDPGWIMLGKYENGRFTPSAVGGDSGIVQASFFSATETGVGTGTWAFTPDATVAQRLGSAFGRNYFDAFALVFKAGNGFAAYDFTPELFGAGAPGPAEPIMNWYGSYDVSDTLRAGGKDGLKNPAGLSHITLWARDPALPQPTTEVPEPAGLGLVGIAALALLRSRRRAGA